MVAAGVGAPLVARHIRPGFVVAGALALSVVGYLMLSGLDNANDLGKIIVGFSLVYLGLGTIAALGTDLVVTSAPAEKAGSASAMSETVQDLGASLGIAILGSIATAVYRGAMAEEIPEGLSVAVRASVGDSLWAASSVQQGLPNGLMENAQAAFITGFSTVATLCAIVVSILTLLAAVALRKIPPLNAAAPLNDGG
jgi:DHA2 family multidrug resistance protein-like MFS transporter